MVQLARVVQHREYIVQITFGSKKRNCQQLLSFSAEQASSSSELKFQAKASHFSSPSPTKPPETALLALSGPQESKGMGQVSYRLVKKSLRRKIDPTTKLIQLKWWKKVFQMRQLFGIFPKPRRQAYTCLHRHHEVCNVELPRTCPALDSSSFVGFDPKSESGTCLFD